MVCIFQRWQINTPARSHIIHLNNIHYLHFNSWHILLKVSFAEMKCCANDSFPCSFSGRSKLLYQVCARTQRVETFKSWQCLMVGHGHSKKVGYRKSTINPRSNNNSRASTVYWLYLACVWHYLLSHPLHSTSHNDSWWNGSNFNLTFRVFSLCTVLRYSVSSGDSQDVAGLHKQSLEIRFLIEMVAGGFPTTTKTTATQKGRLRCGTETSFLKNGNTTQTGPTFRL